MHGIGTCRAALALKHVKPLWCAKASTHPTLNPALGGCHNDALHRHLRAQAVLAGDGRFARVQIRFNVNRVVRDRKSISSFCSAPWRCVADSARYFTFGSLPITVAEKARKMTISRPELLANRILFDNLASLVFTRQSQCDG